MRLNIDPSELPQFEFITCNSYIELKQIKTEMSKIPKYNLFILDFLYIFINLFNKHFEKNNEILDQFKTDYILNIDLILNIYIKARFNESDIFQKLTFAYNIIKYPKEEFYSEFNRSKISSKTIADIMEKTKKNIKCYTQEEYLCLIDESNNPTTTLRFIRGKGKFQNEIFKILETI